MARLTKYEMETTINFNEEEDYATCYTHNKALQRKLDVLAKNSSVVIMVRECEGAKTYKVPKKWVKVSPPKQYSEKTREEMIKRARENLGKRKEQEAL